MKLVFIEQDLQAGINRVQVAHICENYCVPPVNAFAMCELPLMSVEEGAENGVNKYEADVEVAQDEKGNITSIKLVSDLIKKKDIKLDERYIKAQDEKRKAEYKEKVDGLTLEKIREQLNDKAINKLVAEIKVKYPKGV